MAIKKKKRSKLSLEEYFDSLVKKAKGKVVPYRVVGEDLDGGCKPVGCPPFSAWNQAYDKHDPQTSIQQLLEKHIAHCGYCQKNKEALIDLVQNPVEEPDEDCPPYRMWLEAYSCQPILEARRVLEQHVARCPACQRRNAYEIEMAEKFWKEQCKDMSCKIHHPKGA